MDFVDDQFQFLAHFRMPFEQCFEQGAFDLRDADFDLDVSVEVNLKIGEIIAFLIFDGDIVVSVIG